jgi:hypothetical protein
MSTNRLKTGVQPTFETSPMSNIPQTMDNVQPGVPVPRCNPRSFEYEAGVITTTQRRSVSKIVVWNIYVYVRKCCHSSGANFSGHTCFLISHFLRTTDHCFPFEPVWTTCFGLMWPSSGSLICTKSLHCSGFTIDPMFLVIKSLNKI